MLEDRLKETRELLELKGKDIGKTLGVSNKTIYGYENNYDTIPLRNLIKYANEYSFSLDYLFGLTNKNELYKPIKIDLNVKKCWTFLNFNNIIYLSYEKL